MVNYLYVKKLIVLHLVIFPISSMILFGTIVIKFICNLTFRGANFSLVEDTQMFLSEKKEGVHAYVS